MAGASIVTPTYNSDAFLTATVESVLAQTLSEWEMFLVDDGSTDGTVDSAQAWERRDKRIHLVQGDHRGPNEARNRGFQRCSPIAKAVIFLDHDDVWEPDALAVLSEALASHPEAPAAYGLASYIDVTGQPFDDGLIDWQRHRPAMVNGSLRRLAPEAPTTFEALATGNRICTPGQVLIRRSAMERLGGWDVEMFTAADYDLWVRLALLGGLVLVDRRVIGWRQHDGNLSGRLDLLDHYNQAVRLKFHRDPASTDDQRRALDLGYRYIQRSLVRMRLVWAQACFTRGRLIGGLKQLRHAGLAYTRSQRGIGI